ncbi:MAG: hypothetical protein QOD86_1871 [Miltoncostaeaceae bacterium]|nr:hypothetical protein [Miltoncostaeaceae bacterium]
MRLLCLVLGLAGVLAGCGGHGGGEPAAPAPTPVAPTPAGYAAAINRLCERHLAEVGRLTSEAVDRAELLDLSRRDATAEAIALTLPVLRRSFAEARALPRPPSQARRLALFWARADDSVALLRRAERALRAGDDVELARARGRIREVAADTRPVAKALHLRSCLA